MSAPRHVRRTRTPNRSGLLFALFALFGLVARSAETAPPAKSDHWAFKSAGRPAVPGVKDTAWPLNQIDNFVLARLEATHLAPSPKADRRTLIRRLCFDLVGLPPAPEEVAAFVSDKNPDAYEKLVDRLLGSPRYGERWARYWLDVVHYGESHGYDKDKPRPNAWPYRDYVIRSFNNDAPYSRFVQEQLAGDVLFPDSADGVIATGFIAAGPWDFVGHVELPESKTDGLIARYNDRDDMVMNTMSTFLSLTVHCARCHDHKFDPISQEEYYALQAVFAGVDRADRPFDREAGSAVRRRKLTAEKRKLEARHGQLKEIAAAVSSPQLELIDARLKQIKEQLVALPQPERESQQLKAEIARLQQERENCAQALLDEFTRSEVIQVREQLAKVNQEIEALPRPQMVYAAANNFAPNGSFVPPILPRPIHLLKRGDVKRPGARIPPGTLKCVAGLTGELAVGDPQDEGNRRAALARWITDPLNTLTRRSIVNRVWQYHFGRGIVETPNDFGHMGALPTHPELLDWLAWWFLEQGESLKKLHRLIVTSRSYRQISSPPGGQVGEWEREKVGSSHAPFPVFPLSATAWAAAQQADGDNRLLWRMNRQRLDAESFRDTLLLVSGQLDFIMGGPSAQQFYFKDDHSPVYDYTRFDIDSPAGCRRSIYRFIVRSVPDPFMEVLDCPDANLLTPKRNVTLTALQALSTLNNPFVLRQSEHFAARLQRDSPDLRGQIERACQLALSRPPRRNEAELLRAYARKHGLANACRLLINSNEFLFID